MPPTPHPLPCWASGLGGAIGLIEPIKAAFPAVSYADLFQMASAVAVEVRVRNCE